MKRTTLLMIGGGAQGTSYSDHLQTHRQRVKVVGMAEPREPWRMKTAQT